MCPKILGKEVGPIGYGLMSLGLSQEPLPDEVIISTIKTAIDAGCTYLDGGEFYGTPENNSLVILRKYFDKYPDDANKVVINIKGGMGSNRHPNGSKEFISSSIENCLKTIGPVARIDQFEAARKDTSHDYETETLATIDSYVKAGKIGGISCSEINAKTLRSAAEKFDITAVELEVSLFNTDALSNGLLETCGELNIPVLAYSPLGKGFLGGAHAIKSPEDLAPGDVRRLWPRFQGDNFYKNLELVSKIEKLAERKGCTTGQIGINWLRALSKRPGMPTIIPIPGSSNANRVRENAVLIDLTDKDLAEIDSILETFVPAGERYPAFFMKDLNL